MPIFFSVFLVGGETEKRGNVYAINPVTGIDGPVCDDFWDLNDVSSNYFLNSIVTIHNIRTIFSLRKFMLNIEIRL